MAKEKLTEIKVVTPGSGVPVATGKCPRCKKNCTLSSANKTGVTCRKCALQFDTKGVLIGATGASKTQKSIFLSPWRSIFLPPLSFELAELEAILYRENSIIAGEDVPILLKVLLTEKKLRVPERIENEIHDAAVARGDAEPDDER